MADPEGRNFSWAARVQSQKTPSRFSSIWSVERNQSRSRRRCNHIAVLFARSATTIFQRGSAMYSTVADLHAYLIWYVTQERVRAGGPKSATLK